MQQQINLFQPMFRREEKVFSARALVQILVISLVLLLGGAALLQIQLAKLSSTRTLLDDQYRGVESRLQSLEAAADPAELAALDQRVAALTARLENGQAELAEIQALILDRSSGFGPVLEALTRHPLDGLWLTAIGLRDGALELKGRTLDPEFIPRYLDMLAADPVLARWNLATVQLQRDNERPRELSFTLRSDNHPEGL